MVPEKSGEKHKPFLAQDFFLQIEQLWDTLSEITANTDLSSYTAA